MILFYHMVSTLALILVLPLLPLVWMVSEKRRANLLQRLGLMTGIPPKRPGTRRIWLHALSVGEVISAFPLARGMKERMPDAEIVFTASTRTGYETAVRLMAPQNDSSQVFVPAYFPYDVWLSVMRVYKKIRPDLVCLVETDLWPGFLSLMKARNVPVVLVNARLSERSLKGYLTLGQFAALFFSGLSHVMAQTRKDAQGFRRLGLAAEKVSVAGNIKFDQPDLVLGPDEIDGLKQRFGIGSGQLVWIAGSTHEGEEAILLDAFFRIRPVMPGLKLIIAPRDPGRATSLLNSMTDSRAAGALLSDGPDRALGAGVVFIDSLGELAKAYAVCDLAFVGGSMVPLGGHNPLEPAMFGRPILFGAFMTDFHEVAALLTSAGGAVTIDCPDATADLVSALLGDPDRRRQMGAAARTVFSSHSGAVKNSLDIIEEKGFA